MLSCGWTPMDDHNRLFLSASSRRPQEDNMLPRGRDGHKLSLKHEENIVEDNHNIPRDVLGLG